MLVVCVCYQMCLDVLWSAEGARTLSFGRGRRGKDRRQAVVLDASTKELRHR